MTRLLTDARNVAVIEALLAMRTKEAKRAAIAALPLVRAIDVLIAYEVMNESDAYELLTELLWPLAKRLDDSAGAWATATADRLTGWLTDPAARELTTAKGASLRAVTGLTVLLALVRAKVPLRPEWDALFTIWDLQQPVGAEVDEILAALPAERRDRAAVAIAGASTFETGRVAAAMRMLPKWPSAPLVHAVLAWLPKALRAADVKPALKALALTSPIVAAALKSKKGSAPRASLWMCDLESVDTLGALDAVGQAQLIECQRRYGGQTMTAAAIMATDNADLEGRISPEVLDRGGIVDATGRRRYDFWLYGGDAGTFFRARTAEVVADFIQDTVDGGDDALREALTLALRSPPKKTAAKKTAAKKTAAKKTAAKKKP